MSEAEIPTNADIDDAAILAAIVIAAYCGAEEGVSAEAADAEARDKIAAKLAAVRSAERERCARIADEVKADGERRNISVSLMAAAREIAEKIMCLV